MLIASHVPSQAKKAQLLKHFSTSFLRTWDPARLQFGSPSLTETSWTLQILIWPKCEQAERHWTFSKTNGTGNIIGFVNLSDDAGCHSLPCQVCGLERQAATVRKTGAVPLCCVSGSRNPPRLQPESLQ
jgi:hypothetical protein